MKKKILALLLCLVLGFVMLPGMAMADNIADGDGNWYIDADGCLHITGTVGNSTYVSEGTPWMDKKASIKSVVAEEGARLTVGSFLFYHYPYLTNVDLSKLDTSETTHMNSMFSGCSNLSSVNLNGIDTSNVTTMQNMFDGCTGLTELDLSGFDTSSLNNMDSMFKDCNGLTTLDISSFDTSKVTAFSKMFYHCEKLQSIDLSNFDTSSALDMQEMFSDCWKLEAIDVSGFDTSSVKYMNGMFQNCIKLQTLDLSAFETQKVQNMQKMFDNCVQLTSLDLSNFDTSSMDYSYQMNGMFTDCNALLALNIPGKLYTENKNTLDALGFGQDTTPNEPAVVTIVKNNHQHDEDTVEGDVPATCTTEGATGDKYCSVCGMLVAHTETIQATGHIAVTDAAVAPTCTATGLTEGSHCDVCGDVLVQQNEVGKVSHDFANGDICVVCGAVKVVVSASVDNGGTVTGSGTYVAGTEVIITATPKEGYWFDQWEWVEQGYPIAENPFTFTASGNAARHGVFVAHFKQIVHVEQVNTDQSISMVVGQQPKQLYATILPENATNQYVTWASGDESIATVTPNGLVTAVAPGVVSITVTSDDGQKTATCQVTVTCAHQEVIDKAVEATCTTEGKTEGKHCSVCNEVLVAQTTVKALGHTEVVDKAVEATCTKEGKTEGKHCSVCNEVLVKQEVVAKTAHNYKDGVCEVCGAKKPSSGGSSSGGGGTYVGPSTSTTTVAKPALTMNMQVNNKDYKVNGKTFTYDVAPFIVGDRTMVPVRVIMETLGAKVDWNGTDRSVTITLDGKVMTMTIDQEIPGFGTAPFIQDDRTYVPIRYIMENAGAKVDWNATTGEIVITK